MELLNAWFKANQLSLNVAKTVLMTFWDDRDIRVEVGGVLIPRVTNTKFLGVNVDNKLTWNTYVESVYTKLIANRHLLQV